MYNRHQYPFVVLNISVDSGKFHWDFSKIGDLLLKQQNKIIKLWYDWKESFVVAINGDIFSFYRL